MNILFINSARTWGGTEKWVRMAAESLSISHKVSLVYRRAVVGDKITVHKYRLPCISHIDLYSLVKLVGIIKRDKIDILIPTKRKDYVLAGLAGKLTATPVILRLGANRFLHWPWQRLVYNTLTSGIIVNAYQTKQTLLKSGWFPEEKIRVIYNGLDIQDIDRRCQEPLKKPFKFTITALGRVTKNKGFDFLIRAFYRFVQTMPDSDAGLIIIGDGTDLAKFKNLAHTLRLQKKILFTGFLENPYPLLAVSDIFTMTSTNEGLPNALLEAMYLENAPISTYAGGTAEVISDEENGFLVNYGDEIKLADTIIKLYLDRKALTKIAQNARKRVITRFSTARMKREIEQFLST